MIRRAGMGIGGKCPTSRYAREKWGPASPTTLPADVYIVEY
jgi:hypothetical protein